MNAARRRRNVLIAGTVLMLVALFSYVATLDESDPEVLSESAEQFGEGSP